MKDIYFENSIIFLMTFIIAILILNMNESAYKKNFIKSCIKYNYVEVDNNIFYCEIRFMGGSKLTIEDK